MLLDMPVACPRPPARIPKPGRPLQMLASVDNREEEREKEYILLKLLATESAISNISTRRVLDKKKIMLFSVAVSAWLFKTIAPQPRQ
jgi:hypothetical protein